MTLSGGRWRGHLRVISVKGSQRGGNNDTGRYDNQRCDCGYEDLLAAAPTSCGLVLRRFTGIVHGRWRRLFRAAVIARIGGLIS